MYNIQANHEIICQYDSLEKTLMFWIDGFGLVNHSSKSCTIRYLPDEEFYKNYSINFEKFFAKILSQCGVSLHFFFVTLLIIKWVPGKKYKKY